MAAVERDEDEVIELSRGRVLVTSEQLALALRRLTSLLHSHPNPGLTRRMLRPVFLALWSLASWPRPDEQKESSYCKPARRLLEIFLRLTDMAETLGILGKLIQHLTCKGGRLDEWSDWAFDNKDDKSIHVVVRSALSSATPGIEDLNLGEVDGKASALVSLMKAACSDADISALFLDLFKRWFEERNTMKAGRDIIIKEEQDTTPLTGRIFELQILQKLMDELPDKLMGRSDHMLELVSQMIGERDEDVLGVTLSLLNLVITSPLFRKSAVKKDILEKIETSLDSIKDSMAGESASTARNLSLLLRYRDELQDPAEAAPAAPTDRQVEDRKTYKLGLSYITQADAPPPVRVEGLNLISGLIVSNSPVLDITSVIVLLCTLLAEDDDYINMKVIKMFTQLTTKHPRSVVNELVDRYVDASEKASVDTRLRFGEALLQVIERLGETFTGDLAKHTCESLLSIAGRRGYRPKTEKRQQREAQRAQMKRKEADDAWGGEALELSEDEEEAKQDEKTKARNAILAAIVAGWESKRGSEDVRVRASALAIVRTALETSLIGVGPSMASAAVDLCLDVLAMEPEMEKAILRRAAITVILSFVLALNKARERRVNLGFGLEGKDHIVTVLEYIAEVDNDGLVQQHARDALESLENWTVTTLQPTDQMQYGTLNSLAGLSVNPLPGSASKRPRIEEVE